MLKFAVDVQSVWQALENTFAHELLIGSDLQILHSRVL